MIASNESKRRLCAPIAGISIFVLLAGSSLSGFAQEPYDESSIFRSLARALYSAFKDGLDPVASTPFEAVQKTFPETAAHLRNGQDDELQQLLKRRCAACHSGDHAVVKGFDVLDLAVLRNKGFLLDSAPRQSPIWQRIENGDMPPRGTPPLLRRERQRLETLFPPEPGPSKFVLDAPVDDGGPLDFVTFAERDGRFSIILDWARQTNRLPELKNAKGPLTVFAPTDEALRKLDPRNRAFVTNNPSLLLRLLLNHVLNNAQSSEDLAATGSLKATSGYLLSARKESGAVWINDARIVEGDIQCKNGTLHIVDKVIIRPDLELPVPVPVDDLAGFVMVLIRGDEFKMGSDDDEEGRVEDEGPQHSVSISTFYISRFETTKLQYSAVMGVDPSAKWPGRREVPHEDPVQQVTWFEAVKFCNELSRRAGYPCYYVLRNEKIEKNGRKSYSVEIPDPSGIGYRLPTEAEWEYACRGGQSGAYCFGNDVTQLKDFAWYGEPGAHPVGLKRPNGFGLYDMHGNVAEWTGSWYGRYTLDNENTVDPPVPQQRMQKVVRGGSYFKFEEALRSAARFCAAPHFVHRSYGFRVARSAEPKPEPGRAPN